MKCIGFGKGKDRSCGEKTAVSKFCIKHYQKYINNAARGAGKHCMKVCCGVKV